MSLLTIDLQEGFEDDTVIIRIDDYEVFKKSDVTTRTQIGFADRFKLETVKNYSRLEIELPQKNIKVNKEIGSGKSTFVGIKVLKNGKVAIEEQSEEFRYL